MSDRPQVRHFHLVQPDPYHPGHWYLASGDSPSQSHVWLSKDDGGTWIDVTDPIPVGTKEQSVHRFTSLVFTKDYLWWATDDLTKAKTARLVRCERGEPLHVKVMGDVGNECMRSAVMTDYGMIFISEQKNRNSKGAHIYLYTKAGDIVETGLLPRSADPQFKSVGTCSLASKVAVGSEFFTYGEPMLFRAPTAAYRWRLQPQPAGK